MSAVKLEWGEAAARRVYTCLHTYAGWRGEGQAWGARPKAQDALSLLLAHLPASPVTPKPAGQSESPGPGTCLRNWPWPPTRAWEGRQPPAAPWGVPVS